MLTTGLIMVLASFSYAIIIINDPPFILPFADIHGELVQLKPHFGWSWYLNLFTGIAVVALAILILVLNYFIPRKVAVIFHHSMVEEDEFFQVNHTYIRIDTSGNVHMECNLLFSLSLSVNSGGGRRGTR